MAMIMNDQFVKMTNVTQMWNQAISTILDWLLELSNVVKALNGTTSPSGSNMGIIVDAQTSQSIKLDFPMFNGSDLKGWIY